MSDACLIAAGAELTIVHAGELKQAWLSQIEPAHTQVFLSLADVQEMDSAGVQLLIALQRHLLQEGKTLVLQTPSRVVRDVLDLFALNAHFGTGTTH